MRTLQWHTCNDVPSLVHDWNRAALGGLAHPPTLGAGGGGASLVHLWARSVEGPNHNIVPLSQLLDKERAAAASRLRPHRLGLRAPIPQRGGPVARLVLPRAVNPRHRGCEEAGAVGRRFLGFRGGLD